LNVISPRQSVSRLSPPRLAALYASDEPALSRFFFALGRIAPLRGISFERTNDLLRLAVGLYPPDPVRPYRMWIPSSAPRWRPRWHGPWLRRLTRDASVVFLTRPEQAVLLPFLAGKTVAYYAIDDYRHYAHFRADDERALVERAAQVFVCSSALAEKFSADYAVPADRLHVLPMGVPARHVPAVLPAAPAPLPENLGLPRPLFGVLGAINYRLRLDWLLAAVTALPWAHWLFVGYVETGRFSAAELALLRQLQAHPRCTFLGRRDYDALPAFAAALDAAVIPYNDRTTNPCASPMRLHLSLPFGTPIVASADCAQINEHQSDVTVCSTAAAMIAALETLRSANFDDGHRLTRWQRGQVATWEHRAAAALACLHPSSGVPSSAP
jgi:glycosyltransferase involved in cell wall biosynthesis